MASPYIRRVSSQAEMDTLLSEKSLVVVGFHAEWSALCRKIAPFYSRLAAKHRNLNFVKVEVDADNLQFVAQKSRITALPTFIVIKNEEEIDRIRGPDRKALEDMIVKHAPEAELTASDPGSTDGIAAGDESLLEFLDMRKVNCLNEAQHHPLKSIVEMRTRNTTEAYLESDADEQLLITLSFNQEVKVRSVVLYAKDPKFGPKKIKIGINNLAIGFDDVDSATEPAIVQVLEVPEEVVKEGKPIHLRFVRLQHVNSLHIFVESNHGEDITRIDAIDVYGRSSGEPSAITQMNGLRDFWGIHRRAMDLYRRFDRYGDPQNLSDAITLLREAALLCPVDDEQRTVLVGNLAAALLDWYQHQRVYADLSETILLSYEVLDLCPPGHRDHALSLGNLSSALLARYECKGSLSDLEEAIERYRQALSFRPPGHPDRAQSLGNIAVALKARYECTGGLSDLEEAIEKQREALALRVPGHPDRVGYLNNLSNTLLARYRRTGSLSNLEEAIETQREALSLFPPDHPDHAKFFINLSNALLTRYGREGNLSDLEEAIGKQEETLNLFLPGHPGRAGPLNTLATALLDRYEREGNISDVEAASAMYREALNLHPPGHPDHAGFLSNLSNTLLVQYKHKGSRSDLEEAIETQRGALDLRPSGHPDRADSLSGVANALLVRYTLKGSLTDLEEAIEKQRAASELYSPEDPSRATFLNNISSALLTRYKHSGGCSDLEEAIETQREALDLRPPGHPERAGYLNNIANILLTRYEREGNLSDLEETIARQREALDLLPSGHPYRALSLCNLSVALRARYARLGKLSDLEEAIETQREALHLRPPGNPDRASSLSWLATALLTRYTREGSLPDLEEAIEKQRASLDIHLPGHTDRATSLSNLSNALLVRFDRDGSLLNLEEAIETQREALDLRPTGHPDHATSLTNIANALLTRYRREGSLLDLEEAIEKQREAVDSLLPGHPERASSLHNLSGALLTRYRRTESLSDLEEATEQLRNVLELHPYGHPRRSASLAALSHAYFLRPIDKRDSGFNIHDYLALIDEISNMLREAVYHPNSPPLDRLKAALQWIDSSTSLTSGWVLDGYSAALDLLDIVLATSSTLASKHARLSSEELTRCKQLGAEAASCAVRQGDMIRAVEFLERGRNLLFTQIGRYRIDLEELQKKNAELAKRFSDLSSLLDSSVVSNQPTLEGRTAFEDSIARYRRVASDWDQAVKDIRAVPGFENFLRPPHYTALRAAAAEGPVVIVIPDSGQSHALIIVQGRDTPHYIDLPKASKDEIFTLCRDFFEAVQTSDEDDADSRMTALLRKLWVRVVGPVADALENEVRCPLHSRIWWCPSSFLSFLPLHAAGRYGSNADPNQNFPARHVSSYTPTLQALGRARSRRSHRKGESMLIVAQPDTPGQGRLPNTIPEAKVVKTLAETKMKMKTTLLSSKEGTRAGVLNRMVDHSWVHLTCHGSQNFGNPFESCFCLYDNQLTLKDIIQRGLPDANFAFLAACHTATGDFDNLDEGLHLAAGLQFVGFQSVVGTMWEVADVDGPVIAEAFYEALQPGGVGEEGIDCRGAAQALSIAVKYLRDSGVPISRWIRHIHIGI